MPLFNPLKLFVFPFVFLVALPLALCAGATTILAFLVLFLRLFLVYFDLGLETLRYILLGHGTQARYIASRSTPAITPASSTHPTPIPSPASATFGHRRRARRPGSGGNGSGSGSITPVSGFDDVFAVTTPSIGLERDFEGVGGWRLDNVDEQQWYNLNSRLLNPYRRHHFRSQSGGAVLAGPASARAITRSGSVTGAHSPERTKRPLSSGRSSASRMLGSNMPQGLTKADEDGYFPLYGGKNTKKLVI
ncbi:hypothetical protein SAMD00023353_2400010 [Rosellinia necatrix]|uniref:Uncharacterized protein n=1 Tax=Rosellinia necatrix TaxID=77044 RepID=A0A1W2TFL6_ROSNE|nr:hypothetical protein SAMD00023353_2400010 [Rosellinia necatrix]